METEPRPRKIKYYLTQESDFEYLESGEEYRLVCPKIIQEKIIVSRLKLAWMIFKSRFIKDNNMYIWNKYTIWSEGKQYCISVGESKGEVNG